MDDKINLNYLENYAQAFSQKVCLEYFGTKKYMSGQEIIQLTPSSQVNFMIIKALFEKWNDELEKLKANPFFDYRDIAVAEALKEFMNVLSRAIKIERSHFESLLEVAVIDTIILAIDPMVYFYGEIEKAKGDSPALHLKSSKKYIKWHDKLLVRLIDKGGHGDAATYKEVLSKVYEGCHESLVSPRELLEGVNQVLPIDWEALTQSEQEENMSVSEGEENQSEPISEQEEQVALSFDGKRSSLSSGESIDPALAWARFEAEQSGLLKGPIDSLDEGAAINQRFMFTKKLFDGNPDLMSHAFKIIDQCDSFVEAIELINDRYVSELNWDKDSEEVNEFLHLVYRKFDEK